MKNSDRFVEAMAGIDDDLLIAHFERKCPTRSQKIRRYVMAATAYAAACLVVALLIPFIIGNGGQTSPDPGKDSGIINTDKVESTEPKKDPPEKNPSKNDNPSATTTFLGCDFTITLDKGNYTLDDTIIATVTLTNNGDKDVGLWQGYLGDFLDDIRFFEDGVYRGSYSSEWGYGYSDACQCGPFEPGGSITHVVEFTPGAPSDPSDPVASMDSVWTITAFVAYYEDTHAEDPFDGDGVEDATVTIVVPHEENGGAKPEENVTTDTDRTETTEPEENTQPQPTPKKYYSIYDAKRITAKDSGAQAIFGFSYSEYLDGKTPMYKITFWESRLTEDRQVYRIRYDYTFDTYYGKIVDKKITENDSSYKVGIYEEVYRPQNSIPYGYSSFYGYEMVEVCEVIDETLTKIGSRAELQNFINNIKENTSYSEDNHDDVYKLVYCLSKYDDAFFAENVIYVHAKTLADCDLSPNITQIAVDGSTLNIGLQEYRPTPYVDGVKGSVFVLTFDREDLSGVTKVNATSTVINLADPEDITSQVKKTYPDPAKSVRVRFFKDIYMTDEYKSASDIPYGARVYYLLDGNPGYIFTNFKINVYKSGIGVDFIPNGGCGDPVSYFTNNYHGDRLEYSYTAVLAGDADGNLYYDENDVKILRMYLDDDPEMLERYGDNGYSEELDYDCNGVVNKDDLAGLLLEIENGYAERNTISRYKYDSGVGTMTVLMSLDKAEILPHGLKPSQIQYDYGVFMTSSEASALSNDIKSRYSSDFYNMNDLILIYCYTKDGGKPEPGEISELWYTYNNHTAYLTPVYSDDNVGQKRSEYAFVIGISNNKYFTVPVFN